MLPAIMAAVRMRFLCHEIKKKRRDLSRMTESVDSLIKFQVFGRISILNLLHANVLQKNISNIVIVEPPPSFWSSFSWSVFIDPDKLSLRGVWGGYFGGDEVWRNPGWSNFSNNVCGNLWWTGGFVARVVRRQLSCHPFEHRQHIQELLLPSGATSARFCWFSAR